jgi:long-chain acyl-CoA synthetase
MSSDRANRDEVVAMLTGPGGMFEVVDEDVRGIPMQVYKQRMKSLGEVWSFALAAHADKEYVVYGDRRVTYGEIGKRANAISAALAAEGVGPGDRVAVLSANNPEWIDVTWATVQMGAVLAGLNGWWKTDEIIYGLKDSGAKVLIADGPRFERIAEHLGECPDLLAAFVIGDSFEKLVADLDAPAASATIDEDDPAVILYTSGTTGKPKGAISTHRSMIANLQNTMFNAAVGAMTAAATGPGATDFPTGALWTSPFFHVSGLHSGIVVAALAGIKGVIPVGRFDPEEAMRLIETERLTVVATVPTMIWRMVEHPRRHEFDLSSVTTVAYGGSPSAGELQRRVQETFPNVRTLGNAYGLTESSSVATVNSGQEFLDRPDSVGRPMPCVQVRIVGAGGADRPTDDVGEVWIRGPIIMPGYWGKPEATAETITDDGWLKTGDVGFLDEDGFLYITDRAKDMLIRGGENVYCVEIENRLVEHPAIAEAAVIGVPHPTLGEEVKAVVRLESDGSRRRWPTSRSRPMSSSVTRTCRETPAASC